MLRITHFHDDVGGSMLRLEGADIDETVDEEALLRGLIAGEADAYEVLVRRYGPCLRSTSRRFLACEQDADDAVQDAFISAFQAVGSFDRKSRLGTWLHRIVVNSCLMRLRRKRRRPAVSLDELLPQFQRDGHHATSVARWASRDSDPLVDAELRGHVKACVNRLPEPYRQIIVLRDLEQLDTDETSELLGISRALVKTRLHRARQALKTLLEPALVDAFADRCQTPAHRPR